MKPEDDPDTVFDLLVWADLLALEQIENPFKQAVSGATPAEDGTWHVILSCGHRAVWVTQPGAMAYCSQCLDESLHGEQH